MISFENLSKSYGGRTLFEGVTFNLNPRERIGLVGRNGHGKTTLMRIVSGEESSDTGRVNVPRNYSIGYLKQKIEFTGATVLDEACLGLSEQERDNRWKAEKILAGLGFSVSDMKRSPYEFSGGYQVRLNLAKVLVSNPNLLLLDEPTNYLDITSIRWLESFLLQWPNELILITHDRSFMDRVVTHTVGIHRQKVRKIEGNTEKFYTQIAKDEEIYEKTRLNEEAKRKDMELFITRFRAKARLANMVQSRVKALDRMGKKDRLEKIKDLEFSFRYRPYGGKTTMRVEDLSFSYDGGDSLFTKLSFSIMAGERVCIVGPNGRGKTTLLKVLAGTLAPQSGTIVINDGIESGVFEQTNIKTLDDSRTVEEEIFYTADAVDKQLARDICGAMMFAGDASQKKIAVLSGGEKSRVMLGKLLIRPLNLLMLDEPTNHLDMESCDSLLEAIADFDGSLVMITHNEMFLHALADKLIVFQGGNATWFDGGYQEFLDTVGWDDERDTAKQVQADDARRMNKKDIRRLRSEVISERSKVLKPLVAKRDAAEEAIMKLEEEQAELHKKLEDAVANQDGTAIGDISRRLSECTEEIDTQFIVLDEASTQVDELTASFEKRLAEIGEEE